MPLEVIIILLLILANGLLAMSEIAVVSSRRARLQEQASAGDAGARAALDLAVEPTRFLSTVQIGITLVGILAGAFGGTTVARSLADTVRQVGWLAPHADTIGVGVVVLAITYLQLVFGELVPKRLALNDPERVAASSAPSMKFLSRLAAPFVHLLTASTELILRLFGIRARVEQPATDEEIRILLNQATRAGVFDPAEEEIVKRVFFLGDQKVRSLITPRTDVIALDVHDPPDTIRNKIQTNLFSRF
ncbi:MAG: hemolysin family protein, partial [Rudaea sp.]